MNELLLDKVAEFAGNILKANDWPKNLHYHNYQHTEYVVNKAQQIAAQSNLNKEQTENAIIAAWLHDLGYRDTTEGHEEVSVEIAQEFLTQTELNQARIAQIKACIMATKMPQSPASPEAEVLCDADLAHLAEQNFFEVCTPLREEWEALGRPLNDEEWLKINETFVLNHQYFTAYGKAVLEAQKQENLKQIKKKRKKFSKKRKAHLSQQLGVTEDELKNLEKKLAKVEGKPDRGIETVFRITSRNHLDLSSMADSKANIMISVNTIIISVIISVLIQKLDSNPHLIIPTTILLISCLITIVFAILATRPNVSTGRFSREDISSRRTNLLFFGNFHRMNPEDYEWAMREMLEDSHYLYGSLIRDIYFLGVVLGKKYRLLRICYTVFMFGLIISVLAFILSVASFYEVKPPKTP